MKYYEQTSKLFSEPDFLRIASDLYEGFIALHEMEYHRYLANDEGFDLSLRSWEWKFKDTTTLRHFNGLYGGFGLYASEEIPKQLKNDWSKFQEMLKGKNHIERDVKLFKDETAKLIELVPKKEHLKLIATHLLSTLNRIYSDEQLSSAASINNNLNSANKRLTWGGPIGVLGTLFHDLSNRRAGSTKRVFIEDSKEDVINFILNNFMDKDGNPLEEKTIRTYIEPSGKKAVKDRINLDDYKD